MTKRSSKRPSGRTRRNGTHAAPVKSHLSINGSAHGAHGNGSGIFARCAQGAAHWTGKPVTFLVALGLIVIWAVSGPIFGYSDTWQLVVNTATTIVTFLMVFLIQNTQNRDTLALQIKLADLIIAMRGTHNRVAAAENMSDAELEALHEEYRRRAEATLDRLHQRGQGQA